MTLQIWPSDLGLASIEPESLQFLACARICAAQVSVIQSTNPFWISPTGELPVYKDGCEVAHTDFDSFTDHLKKQAQDVALDGHLSEGELAELAAYRSLINMKLAPAFTYMIWMDDANFNTFTRRWYSCCVGFPFNQVYVHRRRAKAIQQLHNTFTGHLVTASEIETKSEEDAIQCLEILATKLGDQKYFFGDKPSSLDAIAFGYLCPLLKLPVPKDRLQQHAHAYPTLTRFVECLANIYMPLSQEDLQVQRANLKDWERRKHDAQVQLGFERDREKAHADTDFPVRNKVLFGIAALALSMGLAWHVGLIKVDVANSTPQEEDYTIEEKK